MPSPSRALVPVASFAVGLCVVATALARPSGPPVEAPRIEARAPLLPAQGCVAARVMRSASEALADLDRGEASWKERVWADAELGIVERWLSGAHCTRLDAGQPAHSGLDTLYLSGGALQIAAALAADQQPEAALDVLFEAWAASQNTTREGSLLSSMIATLVETEIVARITGMVDQLPPDGVPELLQDLDWMVARQVAPSATLDHQRAEALLSRKILSLRDQVQLERCWTLIGEHALQIDDALVRADAPELGAIRGELLAQLRPRDPGKGCVQGFAALLGDLVVEQQRLDDHLVVLEEALLAHQRP